MKQLSALTVTHAIDSVKLPPATASNHINNNLLSKILIVLVQLVFTACPHCSRCRALY